MRVIILLSLMLGAAPRLAAQAASRADLLADWERTRANVLAYVDAAPDSMMGFRPTPGVRTWAEQFAHIVETNTDVAAQAIRGLARSPVLGDSSRYLHSKAALRDYMVASYDYAMTAIREATPAQLARTSSMYRLPPASGRRWLELAQEHTIWTFGQVVPYLRLNGVTPPPYRIPL